MALDFFKKIFNKKIPLETKAQPKESKKEEAAQEIKKEREILPEITKVEDKVIFHLIKPHLTEKTTFLSGQNKYVFWVKNDSNKVEVRKAVEKLYKVKVENVNIINPKPKKIRIGRISGIRTVFKKAVVTLPPGQKIEVI